MIYKSLGKKRIERVFGRRKLMKESLFMQKIQQYQQLFSIVILSYFLTSLPPSSLFNPSPPLPQQLIGCVIDREGVVEQLVSMGVYYFICRCLEREKTLSWERIEVFSSFFPYPLLQTPSLPLFLYTPPRL